MTTEVKYIEGGANLKRWETYIDEDLLKNIINKDELEVSVGDFIEELLREKIARGLEDYIIKKTEEYFDFVLQHSMLSAQFPDEIKPNLLEIDLLIDTDLADFTRLRFNLDEAVIDLTTYEIEGEDAERDNNFLNNMKSLSSRLARLTGIVEVRISEMEKYLEANEG